jgi:hypothetical protein
MGRISLLLTLAGALVAEGWLAPGLLRRQAKPLAQTRNTHRSRAPEPRSGSAFLHSSRARHRPRPLFTSSSSTDTADAPSSDSAGEQEEEERPAAHNYGLGGGGLNSFEDDETPEPAPLTPFDMVKACSLVGFAFDAYNDPVDAKWDQHVSGTS